MLLAPSSSRSVSRLWVADRLDASVGWRSAAAAAEEAVPRESEKDEESERSSASEAASSPTLPLPRSYLASSSLTSSLSVSAAGVFPWALRHRGFAP